MSRQSELAALGRVSDTSALSNRNLIINGAMQVAQRGTSATGLTSSQYNSVDRYRFGVGSAGTWTMSQDTDAPSGFAKSLKLDCTTANTNLGTTGYVQIEHKIEGQDVQHLNKGTADAKKMTLSFWCKSNKTGDFQVNAFDLDNARIDGAVITINASATWEYKTVTYDADTTGVLDDDNNGSLRLEFWLDAGTNYTSGTVPTTWQASNNPDRAAGVTLALADSTSNYFQITGVQLEVGDTATEFEHRSYGDELSRCQRYLQRFGNGEANLILGTAHTYGSGASYGVLKYHKTMRANPTGTVSDTSAGAWRFRFGSGSDADNIAGGIGLSQYGKDQCRFNINTGTAANNDGWVRGQSSSSYMLLDAEL